MVHRALHLNLVLAFRDEKELARVTGLSRPEAGRGNRALVAEGYAHMLSNGVYQLVNLSGNGRAEDLP